MSLAKSISIPVGNDLWAMAQPYDRFGNPLNELHQVAIQQRVSENLGNQTVVALQRGNDCRFIIAWQAPDTNGSGIYAALVPELIDVTLRIENRADDVALIFDTQSGKDYQFELSTNLPVCADWGASIASNGMTKTQLVSKAAYPSVLFRLRASRSPGQFAPTDTEFNSPALAPPQPHVFERHPPIDICNAALLDKNESTNGKIFSTLDQRFVSSAFTKKLCITYPVTSFAPCICI